jgi:hypothetical protein
VSAAGCDVAGSGGARLEPGCIQGLKWGAQLTLDPLETAAWVAQLCRHGYRSSSQRVPGLISMDHPEGHQLLFVPASGRLQIRLDLATDRDARSECAARVWEELRQALQAAGSAGSPPTSDGC